MILTAFEPFAGRPDNPAERLLRAVAPELPAGDRAAVVPTSFARAWPAVAALLEGRPPDEPLVLLGFSARADGLRVERRARNLTTSAGADNDGVVGHGPVVAGGAEERRTALDVDALVAAASAAGAPAAPSTDAGGFVCNATYYRALDDAGDGPRPVLFVHVGDWEAVAEQRRTVPAALLALLGLVRATAPVAG